VALPKLGGRYWEDVGHLPGYASFSSAAPFGGAPTWHLEQNPLFLWHEALTRMWSPYETNPLNFNPLRRLLARIDFEALRHDPTAVRVFVCATNVRTGLRHVFENAELSAEVGERLGPFSLALIARDDFDVLAIRAPRSPR